MNRNLILCILSILLAAVGGLTIGLSEKSIFGVILVALGFAGMIFSFYREHWRMANDSSDEII